jgi:predicted nucleic acid-binding protein
VSPAERKYVLDSNLFIKAFRDRQAEAELLRFHTLFAPFEYLSAVVAQELRAGTPSRDASRELERNVLGPFIRRGRIIVPSTQAWQRSGDLLAEMSWREGLELSRVTKAFGNDILLALSCREAGMVLITRNSKDFRRIARYVPFDFKQPWPNPVG